MSTIEPGFSIDSLIWDFGDGTIEYNIANPSHTYDEIGIKTVTLTVFAAEINGSSCAVTVSRQVQIVPEPVVNFFASASCGDEPAGFVDATDIDLNDQITNYEWIFGDGFSVNSVANSIIPDGTNGNRT